MGDLYCYVTPPIDWWPGCLLVEKAIEAEIEHSFWGPKGSRDHLAPSLNVLACRIGELHDLVVEAHKQFAKLEFPWEGDIRDGPFFFPIPQVVQCLWGYALKQDNNGTCYIASPVPLPHLKDYYGNS